MVFTLFLHVTCMWYLESGHNDNCASRVSVNKLPIMPPPNTSHVTKHWCWSGSFAYQEISTIVSEPSRTIDCTDNSIILDVLIGVDEVSIDELPLMSPANRSWSDSCISDAACGAQLFQHCLMKWNERKKIEKIYFKIKTKLSNKPEKLRNNPNRK